MAWPTGSAIASGKTPRRGTALNGVRTASDSPLGYNKGVARTMGLEEQSNGLNNGGILVAVELVRQWLARSVGGNELPSRVAMMADGGGGSLV